MEELLDEMFEDGISIRLVGVRVDNLVGKTEQQLSLFTDTDNEKQNVKVQF